MKKLLVILLLIFVAFNVLDRSVGIKWDFARVVPLNELLNALLAYSAVARACEHEETVVLKEMLEGLLEQAESHGDLLHWGKSLKDDVDIWIVDGVERYKEDPYVTCDEAHSYYGQIFEVAKSSGYFY